MTLRWRVPVGSVCAAKACRTSAMDSHAAIALVPGLLPYTSDADTPLTMCLNAAKAMTAFTNIR